MLERPVRCLMHDERPDVWIGANFWSRGGGPRMWSRYDGELVDTELTVLAEHGITLTRSFFYWPDFMPEPDRLDEALVGRFADFLDRHQRLGMRSVPTFLVGHMSGENWDPSWRADRDLYGDVWLVARQAWYARELTRRFAGHPAVAGWLISNEMPLYGRRDPDREQVAAWAQLLVDAVRAGGGTQPVSLGDGAWGLEVTGHDNGFRLTDTASVCDFLGPHVYRMEDDRVRQHYAAAWNCELAAGFDRPVVLEEFGVTSDFASDEHAAHYYRQTLHNSLLAGATGWIAWNNTDFDALADQDPYRHHAFELHFGLTDAQGAPKPQLTEMQNFARLAETVDAGTLQRPDVETALVVPSYLDTTWPMIEAQDGSDIYLNLRQAYVLTKLADLPVALTRESRGLPTGARLYLVPSVKALLAPTWLRLDELAREGATVYVSYFGGSHANQRGPWYANLNRLFGIRHQLEYGLVEPLDDAELTLRFTVEFGELAVGTKLRMPIAGTSSGRSFLPVEAVEARVVAVDAHDRPALVERRVGAGRVVLGAYPVEYMTALTPRPDTTGSVKLYDALAREAGVSRPVVVDDPAVSADLRKHSSGRSLIWLVNHAPNDVTVKGSWNGRLTEVGGAGVGDEVELAPFGVRVFWSD